MVITSSVKLFPPGRLPLVLAIVALALLLAGIALNYFGGGAIRFSHLAFALGLLAFIVWFSGRNDSAE